MAFIPALLSTLLLALGVSANPIVTIRNSPITLPISRRVNVASGWDLVRRDFKRAQYLRNLGSSQGGPVVNTPEDNDLVIYIANVGVGTPPTNCKGIRKVN